MTDDRVYASYVIILFPAVLISGASLPDQSVKMPDISSPNILCSQCGHVTKSEQWNERSLLGEFWESDLSYKSKKVDLLLPLYFYVSAR